MMFEGGRSGVSTRFTTQWTIWLRIAIALQSTSRGMPLLGLWRTFRQFMIRFMPVSTADPRSRSLSRYYSSEKMYLNIPDPEDNAKYHDGSVYTTTNKILMGLLLQHTIRILNADCFKRECESANYWYPWNCSDFRILSRKYWIWSQSCILVGTGARLVIFCKSSSNNMFEIVN